MNFHKKTIVWSNFHKRIKRVTSLVLMVTLLFTFSQPVYATSDLDKANAALKEANKNIDKIQKQQQSLQNEIESLDEELYEAMLELEELESSISMTEEEIASTETALLEATMAYNNQYASMKSRIKYMYEKNDGTAFVTLLEAGNMSEFLNKVDYVQQVYNYDRDKLAQMSATQSEIAELEIDLQEERAALESDRASVVFQQAKLDSLIASKSNKLENLSGELEKAKTAAKKAEAARQAAIAAANTQAKTSSKSSYNVNGDLNPSQKTSVSGSDIVSFANRYVGGKYVWGGTSLTNGCDCSGFCIAVLKNFGITYKTRITSAGFRSAGQEVSYKYMQPGDIVCYSGHVAIYAGNGKIVEAQSTQAGITNTRSVNCHPIITIRRVN